MRCNYIIHHYSMYVDKWDAYYIMYFCISDDLQILHLHDRLQEIILKPIEFLENLRSRIKRCCLFWTSVSLVFFNLWKAKQIMSRWSTVFRISHHGRYCHIVIQPKTSQIGPKVGNLEEMVTAMWRMGCTQYTSRWFFHVSIDKLDLDLFAFLGPWRSGHRTLPVSGDDQPRWCSVNHLSPNFSSRDLEIR